MTENLREYLKTRRTVPAKNMYGPGPDKQELDEILQISARVPDHGKLAPFYYVVFKGDNRQVLGQKIKALYLEDHPQATDEQCAVELNRFMRAPCVVAVVFRPKLSKHPVWEQIMCVGAACLNMIHGAQSLGFHAQWLSEWYSFDARFKRYLGVDEFEEIAGFIHIGRSNESPADRQRPFLDSCVTRWSEGKALKKEGSDKAPDTAFRFKHNK